MRVFMCLTILVGSATASGAALMGRELVLLRMILRQEMGAEVQAATESGSSAAISQVAPLERALLDNPRVHDLHATMTDETLGWAMRFNAARALAYFGDHRSMDFLGDVLESPARNIQASERNRAALSLLYLGYEFSEGFAFGQLSPPWYPELDAFLERTDERVSGKSPYAIPELEVAIATHFGAYPMTVRGPLSVVMVEQETLADVLDEAGQGSVVMRVPFGSQASEWEEFKDLIRKDDLLYHFSSEEAGSQAQEHLEGYALIRDGLVVGAILTKAIRSGDADLLAFDDFDGMLDLDWQILNADPSHWSLFQVPGALTITTQDGTFARDRRDFTNIFLIDSPAYSGQDFQVTTCLVSFRPLEQWNQAGLLLWNSDDQWLRFNYECGDEPFLAGYGRARHSAGLEIGGVPSFSWYATEQYPEKLWLRIVKRGPLCELYSSTDGETFRLLTASPSGPLYWGSSEVRYVGLYAENGSAIGAPSVDASFEFFEVRALPSEQE